MSTYAKGEKVYYFRNNPRRKVEATFVDQKGLRCRVTFSEKGQPPRTVSAALESIDKIRPDIPGRFVPEASLKQGSRA